MSHRLTRTAVGSLAALAIAAPTAVARQADVYPGNATPPPATSVDPNATPPSVTTVDEGFDWGAAAIGAGGAAAVLMLTMGGASAVSHRHHRAHPIA